MLLYEITNIFVTTNLCPSRRFAKQLQSQGALYFWPDGDHKERIPLDMTHMELQSGDVLQAGKRKFVRMVASNDNS